MRQVQEREAAERRGGPAARTGGAGGGRSALLALQRAAGNGAVTALLRQPVVQRACGCGTCGGCADQPDKPDKDEERPVQREDEQPGPPATSVVSSVATPRVEACAGSIATEDPAGALDIGGRVEPEETPGAGVTNPLEDGTGGTGDVENPKDPLAETAAPDTTCKTLAWSDFPESAQSGALTSYKFNQSGSTFTADFDSASSRRSKTVEKAFDGMLDDCNSTDFENFAFEIDGKPDASCVATKQPGPAKATKKSECSSKIKPLIDAANPVESARLLRHEQYHMKMGCTLAAKATAALAAGKKVTPATLTKKNNTQSTSYDAKAESDHSCNQAGQDKWEAEIDAGLPKVTF